MIFIKSVILKTTIMTFLLIMTLLTTCFADESSAPSSSDQKNLNKVQTSQTSQTSSVQMLSINPELITLLKELNLVKVNQHKVELLLIKLASSKTPLNSAEQYLFLVIQALVKEKLDPINAEIQLALNKKDVSLHKRDFVQRLERVENIVEKTNENDIVALLTRANKLSEQISEAQLVQPDFLQLHLILADYYANQGHYDLAYLEKKQYLKKYYIYRKNNRLATISSLEKSFEVRDKKASNALLKSQNELNIRKVAEVKIEKETQQYNFTLIVGAAIAFILLFFRQLRVRNKLIRLARVDALTGLANRNVLFESGERMVKQFTEQPESLSVLLLDLDNLKKINENFGDHVGDKVLIIVSKLIKETMRSRDVLSRLGEEEFVALLPYADIHKAKAIAMHINGKIAQYDFSLLMSQRQVTISIGVATMIDNKVSFDDLLHCADLAMYQAKEQGRNTVVCYQNIAASQERRADIYTMKLDSEWRF